MADMTSIHFSMGRVEGSEDSSAFNADEQAGQQANSPERNYAVTQAK